MRNVSGQMKSLCADIAAAGENRKKHFKDLRNEVKDIREAAERVLRDSRNLHREMAEDLKNSLRDTREYLVKNVNTLREDFRKKERETCFDLAEASKIWNEMNSGLRSKKSKKESGEKR